MKGKGATPRGFHTHASAFFEAAEAVRSKDIADPLPLLFLWGRTIELALKSFLLAEGVTIAELRSKKLGHNLKALFEAARDNLIADVIGHDPLHKVMIEFANIDYENKRLEYRDTGGMYNYPEEQLILRTIDRLLTGIDFRLKQHYGL